MVVKERLISKVQRVNNKIKTLINKRELKRAREIAVNWYNHFMELSKEEVYPGKYNNSIRASNYLTKIKEIDVMIKGI